MDPWLRARTCVLKFGGTSSLGARVAFVWPRATTTLDPGILGLLDTRMDSRQGARDP